MTDQNEGMIRDSDIKFECRVMLGVLHGLKDKNLNKLLLPSIQKIVQVENKRLDQLRQKAKTPKT